MNIEDFLEHIIEQPSPSRPIIWRESPAHTREVMQQFPDFTFSHVEWMVWAWPGGYPIYYICQDGGLLCSKCANENFELTASDDSERDWQIVAGDVNYEDYLVCDHCGKQIESAYGEEQDDFDDSMDGDHDSAMASAGMGTDEDYGGTDEHL